MRRLTSRSSDSGSSAIIVALSMLVIFGLIGLSVDVGAALAKRQEAQNGADAAALAVASQCLISKTAANCPGDYGAARSIALSNERTDDTAHVEDGDIEYNTPGAHHVRVTVTAEQRSWFLPAVVTDHDAFTVRRVATANYGSPTAGTVTIPITAQQCTFPASPPEPGYEEIVEIWLPQNHGNAQDATCSGGTHPSGGFGWLEGSDCTAEVSVGDDITVGSSTGISPPNGCKHPAKSKDYFKDLVAARTTALIPLFDISSGSGSGATYTITRFAVFELTGFQSQTGNMHDAATTCAGAQPSWASSTCFQGVFLTFLDDPGDFELGGPITELTFTRLVG